MSGFLQALPVTLQHEGGYSDHPADRGGATMRGVTQATYDEWRRSKGFAVRPVRQIETAEVEAVYHERYWLAGKCDALPWPASMLHFDACVNHGIAGAARILQRAVGAAVDGKIGPGTLAAVTPIPARDLAVRLLFERLDFYERICRAKPDQRVFLLGWLARVLDLRRRVG